LTKSADVTTARRTALTVAIVLGLLAAWQFYRARVTAAEILAIAAGLLALSGLFVPPAALAFHRAWMGLALVLGYVNSRILLTLIYYGAVAPTGVVMRLRGHDPLERRGSRRDSYWIRRRDTRQTRAGFERAF
jgi:hypothetical protein